jgi:hypothetical protein
LPEQRLTITRLEHQRVPIALIRDEEGSFAHRFSYVYQYVRMRFVEVAFSTFNDNGDAWHVLVDRHLTPIGADPELGLPCFHTTPHE